MSKKSQRKYRCPWCFKDVPVSRKGFYLSHLSGDRKCVGIGVKVVLDKTIGSKPKAESA